MRIGRRLFVALVAWLLPIAAAAQTYTISPDPFLTVFNDSGLKVSGACVWVYVAGTSTPATTYTTSSGTANANPIIANSAGRFTAYLQPGTSYKFIYENTPCSAISHGTVLRSADNISATPTSSASVDDTGTAGESITAGQCVYLSNGDGGKTQSQWYRCDSATTYSAFAKTIGIATVNIGGGSTGTIRIAGLVTGLTTLSPGSDYYVGSLGALTTTAPANIRRVGQAESSTTLLVTGNPPPTIVGGATPFFGFFDDFRLSLTTATPVTTSDVTAATTLFLTPYTGNRITLFDASGNVETCTSAEVSIAVPATTSQMYDVWAYDSTFGTCTVTLEVLAWTNDTTRATAIARTNGRNVKSGTSSRLYVGSFRTTAVSGQTEDSIAKRYVWNAYNRVRRLVRVVDTTDSWTYATNAWHQANASSANQVDVVVGLAEVAITLEVKAIGQSAGSDGIFTVGIGEDVTNAIVTGELLQGFNGNTSSVSKAGTSARLEKYPAVGRHFYAWLENSLAAVTITFYGDNGLTAQQSGMVGWIEG